MTKTSFFKYFNITFFVIIGIVGTFCGISCLLGLKVFKGKDKEKKVEEELKIEMVNHSDGELI